MCEAPFFFSQRKHMKTCTKCKQEKELTLFSKDKYKKDGRRSACKQCNTIDHLNRYSSDPEGCKKRSLDYRQHLRINNPEKLKASNRNTKLKRAYGINQEQFLEMSKEQNNKCACCAKEKKLVVDHCHVSGKIRELLCGPCNTSLGLLNEDITVIQNLIKYIRKHNG